MLSRKEKKLEFEAFVLQNLVMGFNKVYKSLQEIFPQIDTRVLRAVAIEHNKDVDAAVETVLTEIIPFFIEKSRPTAPSTESTSIGGSSKDVIATTQTADGTSVNAADGQNDYIVNVGYQQSFHDANDGNTEPFYDNYNGHEEGGNVTELTVRGNILGDSMQTKQNDYTMNVGYQQSFHDANDGHDEGGNVNELTVRGNILGDSMQTKIDVNSYVEYEVEGNSAELALSESVLENRTNMNIDVHSHGEADQSNNKDSAKAHHIVSGEPKTSETVSDDKYPESSTKNEYDDILSHLLGIPQDGDNGASHNVILFHGTVVNSKLETEFGSFTDNEGDHGKSYEEDNYSVVGPAPLTNHNPATHSLGSDPHLVVPQDKSGSGLKELDASLPESTASKMETASDIVATEDESTLNASLSQSNQINIIGVLEEIIADARNNKSVISLMKEVELKEQAAEQAKVEAAMGGSDILVKSGELKEMVQQAEEANAMYSGEVYGEKAILGTELRELQSRVLSLSDERDKSLAVLDEMKQTLEVRLEGAQNEIKSAEQEKEEKEKAAMKSLADQELIMEKVVQESKLLKQQAEYNAKLQEFLVDRGRVVDTLQGEIAVICHDVRLLKENFDERVPFSKSLSSSQTSCILASSTSSSKSLILEQADGRVDSFKTRNDRGSHSSTHQSSEDEDAAAARDVDPKENLDDEWELM
ncbi:hypothetical protein ACS0TY_012869 [Phlomoides rotata]